MGGLKVTQVNHQHSCVMSCCQLCLLCMQVGMTVQLTADDYSSTKASPYTIEVKGCNQPVGIEASGIRTQTALTFAWTQNIQPAGSSSITVNWGGGGTIPARGTFTRTVTSAQFTLSMNLAVTNPEKGPMFINNLQLMCLWGPTISLPCGSYNGNGYNSGGYPGSTGTGFVIPASQTLNCPINNLNIPGSWGVDFTQPCQIVATTYWGKASTPNQITLNFAAPAVWTRINDCATWSVTCSPATGNARWQPIVSGGPSGTQICGVDTSTTVPDQTFSIAVSGGFIGAGDQPGDCGNPITVRWAACSVKFAQSVKSPILFGFQRSCKYFSKCMVPHVATCSMLSQTFHIKYVYIAALVCVL